MAGAIGGLALLIGCVGDDETSDDESVDDRPTDTLELGEVRQVSDRTATRPDEL